ncbi:MAG: hypothetical protein HRU11_05010 [Parvularculaceae bacterium]|nr:hypothetical protein [Parvularculaceae bacterium]
MSDEPTPLRDRMGLSSASNVAGSLIRLLVICVVVGVLLAILGIDPVAFWQGTFNKIRYGLVDLLGTGLEGINLFITLLVTGAIIVVPIWLVLKLLSIGKR